MIKVSVLFSDDIEIFDIYGAEKCIQILNTHPSIIATKIYIENVHTLTNNNANILLIPGGEPYQIRTRIKGNGANAIRKFIANGGGYIGICAGAVLAVPKAPTLDLLQHVKTVNDNEWGNSGICGDIKLKPSTAHLTNDILITMIKRFNTNNLFSYKNGPIFNIKNSKIGKLGTPIPIAFFDGSLYHTNNNIPNKLTNQINNSVAIIYGSYGNGSIIISSIHPEYDTSVPNACLLYEMCFTIIQT